jgi:hypothetical protein
MNKNDFLSLIGSKSPVDRQVLAEINELVNIFPYFQTAHLLLLKGLQDNSDIRFENQLKNSAIHIADREVLLNLLKITPEHVEGKAEILKEQEIISTPVEAGMELTQEPVAVTETVEQESKITQESVVVTEPVEPENKITRELVTVTEPAEPENKFIQESEVAAEPVEQENKHVPEPVFEIPEPASFSGDIEQTVIESAKNSEDMIVEIEKSSAEMSEKEQAESTDLMISHSIMVSVEQDSDEPESGVFIINDETSDIEDRIYYMDPGFSVPESEPVSEPEPEHIPVYEPQPEQMTEAEPAKVTAAVSEEDLKNLSKQAQADLIDKFISSSPRIEPKREKTDQPVEDLSQQYTEVKGGFVTETLARIYVNQGYYSKAIDIYEKLCLKFPEKSGYFATQMERIKAIIK